MKNSTRILRLLPIIALALIPAGPAQAATQTWLGNNDGYWNSGANWSPGPLAAGDTLTFGAAGTGGISLTNNTTAGISYAGITFNANGGPFTIGGNSITLGGNIAGGNPSIAILNFDIALGATRTISGANSVITLGGVISGAGSGITRSAGTTLTLSGLNTFDGVVTLSAGTLAAPRLANGGSPSSVGQSSSAAGNLLLGTGTILKYTGPAVSTDRSFTINGTAAGHGATIEASGTGAINWTNTSTPAYGTVNQTRTLILSGSNPGNNTMAALIADNGTAMTFLTKTNGSPGTWVLPGANTYSGVTTIGNGGIPDNNNLIVQFGTLVATTITNSGNPSSIGQSGNSATNLLIGNGAVLKYTGGATTTDRAFTLVGILVTPYHNMGASLDASGTGPIQWTNTGAIPYGNANYSRTLTLTGSNPDNNSLAALIADNGAATYSTNATRLYKGGKGKWILNGPVVNTYTGPTTVTSGTLVEDFSNMTSGYANLINTNSVLTMAGGTLSLLGNASNPSSQAFSNQVFSAGGVGSGLSIAGASGMTLTLSNTWVRNVGSTLNINLGAGGTLNSTPAVDTSTPTPLVKGSGSIAFATVGGTNWAKLSGDGRVVGFVAPDDYVAGLPASGATSTANYSHTDIASVTASETVNTLKLDTTTTGQALTIDAGQTLTLAAGGLLFVGANDYSITGGTLAAVTGGGELVVHQYGSGNLTIGSLLGSTTTLTKAGPGTLTLTNANTYTGATYAGGGGTLVLQNQLALQNSALTVDNSSLVFDSSVAENAFRMGGLSAPYGGPGFDIGLTNSAGAPIALIVGNNNSGGTYYGTLSGPGSLIKVGSGTQNMYGLNTYTGGTVISNGVLQCNLAFNEWFLGGGGPNGNVQVTVYTGGTLGLNRGAINGTLNLNGGTVTLGNGFGGSWAGPVNLGTGTTSTLNGTIALPGVISGAGALVKAGTANVTLTGVNTYTGDTTVSAGTLTVTGSGSIANTPNITLATSTTFDVSGKYLPMALGSGQTLKASATGANAPGKINMASGKGLTLSAGGLVFTAYGGGTNALTLTGAAGSLALNGAPVTVTTTTALAAGTYPLIAPTNSANAAVSGTPGSLTVNGSGLAAGNSASLAVSSGALVMTVDTTLPDRLVFTSVPANPYTGLPFSVTVTAQDAGGVSRTVTSGTLVTLTQASGGGSLSSTLTGAIPAGSTSVTISGLAYDTADTMTLTATATSGMSLTPITSGGITFLLPPTKLAITSVNGGSSPSAAVPFNVVVQAQDSTSTPRGVVAKTVVSLTLKTGSGTLNTPLTATIPAGQNSVTISGVIYSQPESPVALTATRTSGDTLTAGDSVNFTVVASSAKDILTFTFPTLGAATIAGTNISVTTPANTVVTSLAPTYTVSVSASGLPAPGTALDFSSPQTYVITAQDGSQKAYLVTVNLLSVFTWTNSVSGIWSDALNWTNNFGWVGAPAAAGETNYVLNFNQAGTYTATSDLNNGFLLNQLNFGAASGTLTLAGSDLAFTNNGAILPQINQNGAAAVMITNNVDLATNVTYGGTGNGQVSLANLVSGPGSLTMTNSGTLQLLSANNTYSGGTVINAGTITAGPGQGARPNGFGTGPVTLNNGATIQLQQVNTVTNVLTVNGGTIASVNGYGFTWGGNITLNGNVTVDTVSGNAGNATLSGGVSGAGGLSAKGRTQCTLSGVNTYTGNTTISSGKLKIEGAGVLGGGSYAGNITNNSVFIYNSSAAQTLSGAISGSGSLTNFGPGTLTLAGANSYTNTTTVSAGTLLVSGSTASASAVTVQSGGTLGGSGTINGTVTVNAGGTNLLGASGATLTLANVTAPSYASTCTLKILASASTLDKISAPNATTGNSVANVALLIDTTDLSVNVPSTVIDSAGGPITGPFNSVTVIGNTAYTAILDYSTSGQIKLALSLPSPITARVSPPNIVTGDVAIDFDTVIGLCYKVQYTDSVPVPPGTWIDLGAAVQATGITMSVTDPGATLTYPQRFYRVVQVPCP